MDLQEIDREIHRLKSGDTTYNACFKLAALCSVKDHLEADPEQNYSREISEYSFAPPPEEAEIPQTEFCIAFASIPLYDALSILDEHMEAVRMIYPKEYALVMDKLNKL